MSAENGKAVKAEELRGREAQAPSQTQPQAQAQATKRPFVRARKIAAGAVFASVIVSLIWHTGTGTLSALGVSSVAAVCPLGSLETLLTGQDGFLLHPVVLLALAVVAALVFGKAFCAWLCPTPYIQRFFRPKKKASATSDEPANSARAVAAPEKASATTSLDSACGDDSVRSDAAAVVFEGPSGADGGAPAGSAGQLEPVSGKALAPVGGERDGVRIDGRHVVLGGALVSALAFGFPVFCLVCPVGLAFATVIGVWNLIAYNEVTWMLVAMPVVLVLELVVFRRWCTTLCPISALVSLISTGNRTFKPHVDRGKCLRSEGKDCRVCVENCPERVDPHTERIPECSKCGACIEGCPAHAIEMKLLAFGRGQKSEG